MKKVHLLMMLVIGMSFVAAGARAEKVWKEKASGKMVEAARSSTMQVSLADVKKLWDGDEDIILLDVRTPREYEAIHIPGAESAPRGLLEFIIWSLVPDENEQIYVYCRTGARAALATKLLNELGYKMRLELIPVWLTGPGLDILFRLLLPTRSLSFYRLKNKEG